MRRWARKETAHGVPLVWPKDLPWDGFAPGNLEHLKVPAHLDEEELEAIASRVNVARVMRQIDPSAGNVIVLRGNDWYYPEDMVEMAREILGPKGLIITIDGDASIETLDERQMARSGWLRTSTVQTYLGRLLTLYAEQQKDERLSLVQRTAATAALDALRGFRDGLAI